MGRPIIVILLLLAAGAAAVFWINRGPTPPVDQIAAAKQRVQETLVRSEAHRYAPDAAREVQRTLVEIDRSVAEEQKKLPFRRNYEFVQQKLDTLDRTLADLETLARGNKQVVSGEVASAIQALITTAGKIDDELANMPSAKGSRPAIGAMRADLTTVRNDIGDVQSLLRNGQFQQAKQKAAATQAAADSLLLEIQQTKARVRALRNRNGS